MYCFDTNLIIDIFRGNSKIFANVELITDVALPSIVLCELYKGAFLSKNPHSSIQDIRLLLDNCTFLTIDENTCRIYGELFAFMSKKGRMTQDNDLIIAAICIQNNATLMTSNKKHFENIPGLKVKYV